MGGFVRLEQEEQEPAPRLSRGSREAQPDRRARKYAFSSSFSLHGRMEEIRGRGCSSEEEEEVEERGEEEERRGGRLKERKKNQKEGGKQRRGDEEWKGRGSRRERRNEKGEYGE